MEQKERQNRQRKKVTKCITIHRSIKSKLLKKHRTLLILYKQFCYVKSSQQCQGSMFCSPLFATAEDLKKKAMAL